MIRLTETTPQDVEQIAEWLAADPWHRDDPRNIPAYMTTGNGLLSYCVQDDEGPVFYVKLTDNEDGLVRCTVQFAPENVVSKRRTAVALASSAGIGTMAVFAKSFGYSGLVYESISPTLIAFGKKMGFDKRIGENDYAMLFEGK
jgi:hypothetical protein